MARVSLTQRVHSAMLPRLHDGAIAIDATAGNGFDTLYLASHVGDSGHIYAFDIQQQAIDTTARRLNEAGLRERVTLIRAGHEHMGNKLPASMKQRVNCILFNLGYLPRADKSLITQESTTLQALKHALELLMPNGYLSILAYPGHPGGREETEAVKAWAEALPGAAFTVTIHPPESDSGNAPEWIEVIAGKSCSGV